MTERGASWWRAHERRGAILYEVSQLIRPRDRTSGTCWASNKSQCGFDTGSRCAKVLAPSSAANGHAGSSPQPRVLKRGSTAHNEGDRLGAGPDLWLARSCERDGRG
jgi:hypothetical protein